MKVAEAPSAAPEAVRPPPGNPRFPLMDGVRAIAVLSIFVFHLIGTANPPHHWWRDVTSRLDVGVAVFFVVSGFLLYRPFVAARLSDSPAPGVLRYARRRVLRIVPAYWLALTLIAIFPGVNGFREHWWAFYSFIQIYRFDWFLFSQGLIQAWSLCVEVSFYVVLPLLAFGLARLPAADERRRARREIAVLAALALASVAFRAWLNRFGPNHTGPQTLPALFDWFAAGMALALLSALASVREGGDRGLVTWVRRGPSWCWAAALALLAVAAVVGGSTGVAPSTTTARGVAIQVLYLVIAVLVVLPAVFPGPRGLPRRVLAHPVMAWVGLISYGVFLWHVTVLVQLAHWGLGDAVPGLGWLPLGVTGLAATLAIAAASYYAVERPLLRLKEPRRRAALQAGSARV